MWPLRAPHINLRGDPKHPFGCLKTELLQFLMQALSLPSPSSVDPILASMAGFSKEGGGGGEKRELAREQGGCARKKKKKGRECLQGCDWFFPFNLLINIHTWDSCEMTSNQICSLINCTTPDIEFNELEQGIRLVIGTILILADHRF